MMPARLAVLVLLLLALPTAIGARAPEAPPPQPYAMSDGVTYYMAAGIVNGSSLARDSGSGDVVMDFDGCVFVQLRPQLDRGRVSIAGLVDGFTPLRVEFGDFVGDLASQGPIAANLTLEGDAHPLLPSGETARGEAGGEAVAQMQASEYFDFEKNAIVLANFTEPVSGGEELRATLAVAKDGVRDDASGARLDEVARGDEELHVVLRSPEGAAASNDAIRFVGPPDVPDGVPATDAEYTESYEFLNTRFGGLGTLTFAATSKAPPGFNSLTVVVRAPDGSESGNTTVDWSVLAAGAATLEFPLDQLGFYSVIVTGRLLLGSYTIDVGMAAAPSFQLDFWWEDVVVGEFAQTAYGDCQRAIGMRAQVVAGEVARAQPTTFPFEVVALGVGAALVAALLVVKLVQDQVSVDAFRKLKK